MRRCIVLFILLACTACGSGHPANPPPVAAVAPSACRIGPNDGPLLAERGIGGTGMPLFNAANPTAGPKPAPSSGPDRGVGGTGAPKATGNTGIVGEITGFASVCLNGVEVAYDPATQIAIDGEAETPDAMRAGQIAAVVAAPDANAKSGLLASIVSIRHEVAGPVSAVASGTLTVAGQAVTTNADTRGLQQIVPGEWIAVSGFRNDLGTIMATRIDPQPPGIVTVHGRVLALEDGFWISGLKLNLPPLDYMLRNGEAVTVTGEVDGAELDVVSITPDLLYSDPQSYFGPNVRRILIQSYASALGGAVRFATHTSFGLLAGRPGIWTFVGLPGRALGGVGQMFRGAGPDVTPFPGGNLGMAPGGFGGGPPR